MAHTLIRALVLLLAGCAAATAQDLGTLNPKPLPPIEKPDNNTPAKELFGRKKEPVPMAARVIGYYTNGCIAGAKALPINGDTWQVMRLSRHRNWGHPNLIKFLERFAAKVPKLGWGHGLLVGDMAQPRGGPMLTGHWSHQVGLDADIWLTPMPDRVLTAQEREEMMATNVVADDWNDVNPKIWSPAHIALLKAAAQDREVERVLVNPAIKKALCRDVTGDRSWLHKIRPVFGHNYHFHVRISCPADSPDCKKQPATPNEDGCGAELDGWFTEKARSIKPGVRKPVPISALPAACRQFAMQP